MVWARVIFAAVLLSLSMGLSGQPLKVSGRVLDVQDRQPLIAAVIEVSQGDIELQTITDEDGRFAIDDLLPGIYRIAISYVGYQTQLIAGVDVRHGRQRLGDFLLTSSANSFDEVLVKAPARYHGLSVSEIHTITVEEVLRFPATFYDPARVVSNYAGVISENDQANSVSVRGNNPSFVKWFLHDVEIVNPNHLANAGAFGDRSAASGGGVNILSAQLMDYSQFHKGAFATSLGNVLGGAMDMHFRSGDTERVGFKGQIGLIGIDAALEGPLMSGKDHSFVVNYRYSTLGILSAMGVELGDEEIGFQDLAFNFDFSLPRGNLNLFGMGGTSSNRFRSPEDVALWETFKDQQDIDFEAEMGALGASLKLGSFTASVVYSGLDHKRQSSRYAPMRAFSREFEDDHMQESRLGTYLSYGLSLSENTRLMVGTRISAIAYELLTARYLGEDFSFTAEDNGVLLQGFADVESSIVDNFRVSVGLHATSFSMTGTGNLEPRVKATYDLDAQTTLGLAYGLHSQVPDAAILLHQSESGLDNAELDLIKAHHLGLTWKRQLNNTAKLVVELYYQSLFDVPVIADAGSTFSTINHLPYRPFQRFDNRGTGYNTGLEIGYSKYFEGSTFFEGSATYYNSQYTASDGVSRDTRWNGRYAMNLTGGKEFTLGDHDKILGLNLRAFVRGGFWEGPIDQQLSQEALRTVYRVTSAFSEQLGSFYKVDLRVYYKRNRKKYSSLVGLDLLNVTNAKAVAYYIWDPMLEERDVVEQLGLIPNLSYRIEF